MSQKKKREAKRDGSIKIPLPSEEAVSDFLKVRSALKPSKKNQCRKGALKMAKYGYYSSDGNVLQEFEGDSMTQDAQHNVKIWKWNP